MEHKSKENIKLMTALYAFLALIVAYLIIVAVMIYVFGSYNAVVQKTAQYVPYPAAIVGGTSFVSLDGLKKNLAAVRQFYESQDFSSVGLRVDFTTDDGQKRLKIKEKELLNKMIENVIIQKLAQDRGIKITDAMVAQGVDREVAQYGNSGQIESTVYSLYGWNIDDFKEKIVKPDMYKAELEKNMKATDESRTKARAKITVAKQDLQGKTDFAEVAKKYSEGESAGSGGELGWFTADQMMPEIAISAFILNKGDQSDIIESALGFHIIQIEDKKTEDGVDKVKLRQIFIRATNFSDWLLAQEKNINVHIPIKGYQWNKDTASVEFVDPVMKDFENNLDKNSNGDISVLF